MPAIYLLPLEISPCSRETIAYLSVPDARQAGLQCVSCRVVVTAATFSCRVPAMSLLSILEFPHPRLRNLADAVDSARIEDPAFQRLLDDMFETMYEAPGIGLAATQV